MPSVLVIASYLGAGGLLVAFARRWLLRPVRGAVRELRVITAQLRNADRLQAQLNQLAGSVTLLAVALMNQLEEQRQRLDDTTELVVDINADLQRLQRAVAELQMIA